MTLFTNLDRKDWVDFRNHLERMLGRQAYNDGKPEVALVHFLRIILQHSEGEEGSADQDFLDDLQLAWTRLGDNADQISASERLRLSESIFETSQTTIRAEILNPAAVRSDMEAWVSLEQAFLDTGYPYVDGESDKPVKRPFTLLDDVSTNVVITGGDAPCILRTGAR